MYCKKHGLMCLCNKPASEGCPGCNPDHEANERVKEYIKKIQEDEKWNINKR